MTADEIRATIIDVSLRANGHCNAAYLDHTDGLLRGLVWALTGKDPGTRITEDMAKVFELSGVPFQRKSVDEIELLSA